MKQLLYIGRPNLGENMFATPCLDFLSKEYEITFLGPKHTLPVFANYSFLKRVLTGCNFGSESSTLPLTTQNIIKDIIKDGDWYYAYHNDHDVKFLCNHPEILNLKKYPVLHDKEIKIYSNSYNQFSELNTGDKNINTGFFLSRTRKYMLKLQLMSLQEAENYDCTVRCPTFTSTEPGKDIIVYQGSKESLRKLSTETIAKFVNILPDAVYLVTAETAKELNLHEKKIKSLQTSIFTEDSLKNIIKLFETRPRALIGPDSGLTQLATGYKIPLIWLQSRIALENVIDLQYKKHCKVYLKQDLTCKQECVGCAATEALKTNTLPHGLFRIEKILKYHKEMECFKNAHPTCLQYTDREVEEIIKLIN